jgi:putative SOS response-associated peptidase YedK
MCGRYVIISTPEAIRALFGYAEQPNFPPRYNVAPTQPIPIVYLDNGKRAFALARWAFMPAWVKDPKGFSLIINARGETVLDKPAFRAAMQRRRCLIPNDGFYEWKPGAPKRPYFVRARRRSDGTAPPLAFAGLWETWTGPNGEEIDTVAIVTTTANSALAGIHNRMPVFVPPESFELWLDCGRFDAKEAVALIKPADDALLEVYEVSPAVNRVVNDCGALIDPAPAEQLALPETAASAPAVKARSRNPKVSDDQASLF